MVFQELREKHPRLIYKGFHAKKVEDSLHIHYDIVLEPDIKFQPRLEIPLEAQGINLSELENLIFHLGLIECISYWKAACPKEIVIEAGYLDEQQISWFRNLLINGLGEFFFINKLNPYAQDLVDISVKTQSRRESSPSSTDKNSQTKSCTKGNLILVGGGKDSCLTLELLKSEASSRALMLNPIAASIKTAKIAGHENPIICKRTIDSQLLELNSAGYLNGHTPFSAYLAFFSTLVAKIYGIQNVIASNESSANEGNTIFNKLQINHQYSKSFSFEKSFSDYSKIYLNPDIRYFSFLRPLLDLQITALFARQTHYFKAFKSCNVGHKKDSWCESCSKCAFVYLCLFPFLNEKELRQIFSVDLFEKQGIIDQIRALLGLSDHKPLECVGTSAESKEALCLVIENYKSNNREVPSALKKLIKEVDLKSANLLSNYFDNDHLIPEHFLNILKLYLKDLSHV